MEESNVWGGGGGGEQGSMLQEIGPGGDRLLVVRWPK